MTNKLHHLSAPGVQQHITFRLNDSLPESALKRIKLSLLELPEASRVNERIKYWHSLLDQSHGSCILSHEACAKVVEQSLLFGHEQRYQLLAWCVMPNHVHVLLEQVNGWSLDRVVRDWKRFTSREIVRLGFQTSSECFENPGRSVGVWQRGYWDRYIRNEDHMVKVKWYIEQNPVKAALVEEANDWRWSSAGKLIM